MKIGLDIPDFSPARNSGIERYTRNLLRALHRNAGSHELSLYLCSPPGWVEKDTLAGLARTPCPACPFTWCSTGWSLISRGN